MRNYQRKHLRAPFKENILFVDEDFVFKARALNISEGGLLVDQIPHFPEGHNVPMMLALPQLPYFKNYSLEKLEGFDPELFPKKVIRCIGRVVRKIGVESKVEYIMASRFGVQFTYIDPIVQKSISDYVDVFASNLIYLQILIDTVNDDQNNLAKIRRLSQILKYGDDVKLAQLRQMVDRDYTSLQWL